MKANYANYPGDKSASPLTHSGEILDRRTPMSEPTRFDFGLDSQARTHAVNDNKFALLDATAPLALPH
jgi:hypothetical protein